MFRGKGKGKDGDDESCCCCCVILRLEGECESSTFKLEDAVCNHGFFMMAPNHWIPSTKTLQRPLRTLLPLSHDDDDDKDNTDLSSSFMVSISQSSSSFLHVRVHGVRTLSSAHQQSLLAQVKRMLRISPKDARDVKEFQNLNDEAKKRGFGRLFRSPTLFEDVIKSMLLCNTMWERSMTMAQNLCKFQLKLASGQPNHHLVDDELMVGNFPNAEELAACDDKETLNAHCNLGYRAEYILKFARSVLNGEFDLNKFEEQAAAAAVSNDAASLEVMYQRVKNLHGFGPFISANIIMCCGYYQKIPVDSETWRHLKQVHSKKKTKKTSWPKHAELIYKKYAPFQSLAYWLELVEYYEREHGKLSELLESNYKNVSGRRRIF